MAKKNILIVDDDENMGDTLRDILELEGYEVSLARSGEESLELAQKSEFDCFLIDIKMPGMNGIEAIKQLKSIRHNPKVIVMTGFSQTDYAQKAREEGAAELLQKPLDMERLLTSIKTCVRPTEGLSGKIGRLCLI
ncbi:MAG: response regulator [Firmicutes bacterium]|nr:response regulator [Bacillota bacterium]